MRFAYYRRLNKAQKAIYRASDAVTSIQVPEAAGLFDTLGAIKVHLAQANQKGVERGVRLLFGSLSEQLQVARVKVRVLAARPHNDYGELHGVYERPYDSQAWPTITLWMRTAKRRQVVAFKTFLRTALHEFGHHLDYEYLELEDSFHTAGFYERENALMKQILGETR